jgi:hypothetical protein
LVPSRREALVAMDAGDAALASDDGPIFSIVAKLVEALRALHPRGN